MDKVKIHDNCLEYENEIWNSVEQLGDQRIKKLRNRETGGYKFDNPYSK